MKVTSPLPWILFTLITNLTGLSMEIEDNSQPVYSGKNIAVFGAGTTNCYASLILAKWFSEHANRHFNDIFDEAWGISGGAIAATLLMDKKLTETRAADIFRTTVEQALPDFSLLFSLSDTNSLRRNKFEGELKKHFDGMSFGKNNRLVYIASNQKGVPVYYCDEDVKLDDQALRCPPGTSCIKGIVGSCCYICKCEQYSTNLLPTFLSAFISIPSIHLFKQEPQILNPGQIEQEIYDGALCISDDDHPILDGYSPLPLVIKYLQNLPSKNHQKHNVVVFDNGWPHNDKFRSSINMQNNMTIIKTDLATINIFVIAVQVGTFKTLSLTMNRSTEHFEYLEQQARDAVERTSHVVWNAAIKAVTTSIYNREKF